MYLLFVKEQKKSKSVKRKGSERFFAARINFNLRVKLELERDIGYKAMWYGDSIVLWDFSHKVFFFFAL